MSEGTKVGKPKRVTKEKTKENGEIGQREKTEKSSQSFVREVGWRVRLCVVTGVKECMQWILMIRSGSLGIPVEF